MLTLSNSTLSPIRNQSPWGKRLYPPYVMPLILLGIKIKVYVVEIGEIKEMITETSTEIVTKVVIGIIMGRMMGISIGPEIMK